MCCYRACATKGVLLLGRLVLSLQGGLTFGGVLLLGRGLTFGGGGGLQGLLSHSGADAYYNQCGVPASRDIQY